MKETQTLKKFDNLIIIKEFIQNKSDRSYDTVNKFTVLNIYIYIYIYIYI